MSTELSQLEERLRGVIRAGLAELREALGAREPEAFLSMKDAAERLGVKQTKLAELIRGGWLMPVEPPGMKHRRISTREIARYMAEARAFEVTPPRRSNPNPQTRRRAGVHAEADAIRAALKKR